MVTETHHHVCDLFRSWTKSGPGQYRLGLSGDWISLSLSSPHSNGAILIKHNNNNIHCCRLSRVIGIKSRVFVGRIEREVFFSLSLPFLLYLRVSAPLFWLFLFLAGDYRIFTILLYDIPFAGFLFFCFVFSRFQIFVAAALLWPCLNM
jgi:hypothetical protein